jgi:hypothetical protein
MTVPDPKFHVGDAPLFIPVAEIATAVFGQAVAVATMEAFPEPVTVTEVDTGKEVQPLLVTVNVGVTVPVCDQLTCMGPAEVEVAGVAFAPKFQLNVLPGAGALPVVFKLTDCPAHGLLFPAVIDTTGKAVTLIVWEVTGEVQPFCATDKVTVFTPAVDQLIAKGPCMLPGEGVPPATFQIYVAAGGAGAVPVKLTVALDPAHTVAGRVNPDVGAEFTTRL